MAQVLMGFSLYRLCFQSRSELSCCWPALQDKTAMASCSPSATSFTSFKPTAILGKNHSLRPQFAPFAKIKPSVNSSFLSLSITRRFHGGVGKTSCAASLAVKHANNGHPHSSSDSFAQDLTGGMLVLVECPFSQHFALEINPEKEREEFLSAGQKNVGRGVKDFMDGICLGLNSDQVVEGTAGCVADDGIMFQTSLKGTSMKPHDYARLDLRLRLWMGFFIVPFMFPKQK